MITRDILDNVTQAWDIVLRRPRPDYVFDGWRGRTLADFLCSLRSSSREIPGFCPDRPFSLPEFIRGFMVKLLRHDPDIHDNRDVLKRAW